MQETARVVEIKGTRVALVPLDSESCAGCTNARCKEGGYIFYARNPKSLPVQKGSLVRVAASASVQTVEIITGILFPILVAVLVYVFSSVFWKNLGEQGKIGLSLGALGLMFFLSYQIGLRNGEKRLPVIIDIL